MALTPRQSRCYKNRVNLWRPTETLDPNTGEETAKSYTLVAANVPCHFQKRRDVEGPTGIARTAGDQFDTHDEIHFDVAQTIDADWVVKDVTTLADGTNGPSYGKFWVVAGQPQLVPSLGNRRANECVVQATSIPVAPAGVS